MFHLPPPLSPPPWWHIVWLSCGHKPSEASFILPPVAARRRSGSRRQIIREGHWNPKSPGYLLVASFEQPARTRDNVTEHLHCHCVSLSSYTTQFSIASFAALCCFQYFDHFQYIARNLNSMRIMTLRIQWNVSYPNFSHPNTSVNRTAFSKRPSAVSVFVRAS